MVRERASHARQEDILEQAGFAPADFRATFPGTFAAPRTLRVQSCERVPQALDLAIPGSKSVTNRALLLAALGGTSALLRSPLACDDSANMLASLLSLGVNLTEGAGGDWLVAPPGSLTEGGSFAFARVAQASQDACAAQEAREFALDAGDAGTVARFLPALLLNAGHWHPHLQPRASFVLDGSVSLRGRPIAPLFHSLRQLGARIEGEALPARFYPSELSGRCELDASLSGQFLSGLLLAAAGARPSSVAGIEVRTRGKVVQADYVGITIAMLASCGIEVERNGGWERLLIRAPQGFRCPETLEVEADASSACYFLAFGALHGRSVRIRNLPPSTLQPDARFTSFLERMGVPLPEHGPVSIGARDPALPLRGGFAADFSAASDQAITAGTLGLWADAPIRIHGVQHIRGHESDRIHSFCENVSSLGGQVEEAPDGFTVHPLREPLRAAGMWRSFGDHRFAMCGFLAATMARGISVSDPACVAKTVPAFFRLWHDLGVDFAFA